MWLSCWGEGHDGASEQQRGPSWRSGQRALRLGAGVPGTLCPVYKWAGPLEASEASLTPEPQGSVVKASSAPARDAEQVPRGALQAGGL